MLQIQKIFRPNVPFTIEQMRPMRDGLTVSRDSKLGETTKVTNFSLGKGTSISQESYDRVTLYIGAAGKGAFIIGENAEKKTLLPDSILIVPPGTLCGMESETGMVYTEIILEKEIKMNNKNKAGEGTGYEGLNYELSEGQCFKFDKNGLHSVTANGRFKMALLLIRE